jgi:gamma-glutamyl phosphate reductase
MAIGLKSAMANDLTQQDLSIDVAETMRNIGLAAKAAARELARASTANKNAALIFAAEAMMAQAAAILSANANDLARAKQNGHDQAFIDRLTLTEKSIRAMADGVREVAGCDRHDLRIAAERDRRCGSTLFKVGQRLYFARWQRGA